MIAPNKTHSGNTEPASGACLDQRIREEIARYRDMTPGELSYRLAELDHEWSIERVLALNLGGAALAGIVLGATSARKWYLLPVLAGCFTVQHALNGWCPPISILRRLGFRAAAEIDQERIILEVLRGNFAGIVVSGREDAAVASRMVSE